MANQEQVEGSEKLKRPDWDTFFKMYNFSENEENPIEETSSLIKHEDSSNKALNDVTRLKYKDIALYGRCPETDPFITVTCSICSMILVQQALEKHIKKKHGDVNESLTNIANFRESPKVKEETASIKTENKTEKPKKIRSSPPILLDEITKEERAKRVKKLKGLTMERTLPPKLELMIVPDPKKRKLEQE